MSRPPGVPALVGAVFFLLPVRSADKRFSALKADAFRKLGKRVTPAPAFDRVDGHIQSGRDDAVALSHVPQRVDTHHFFIRHMNHLLQVAHENGGIKPPQTKKDP